MKTSQPPNPEAEFIKVLAQDLRNKLEKTRVMLQQNEDRSQSLFYFGNCEGRNYTCPETDTREGHVGLPDVKEQPESTL